MLQTPSASAAEELALIPPAVAPPRKDRNAIESGRRIYLQNALSLAFFRGDLPVPAPPSGGYVWQERLFLDVRAARHIGAGFGFTFSDRLNLRTENDLDCLSHENAVNDLREAYVSWRSGGQTFLDVGRVNLKSGVALGFNPTDFFRARTVVEPLSSDPSALREDRLGTLMVRVQRLWSWGSFTAAFAPGFYKPTGLYSNLNLPSLDPSLDRTNARNRLLAKASVNLGGNFSPELLLYREGSQTRVGANLAETIGQRVVAYVEWSGGRRADLIAEALRYGRETDMLPADGPEVMPATRRATFQTELAVGASYTMANRITVNIEFHVNQAGLGRSEWQSWFAGGNVASVLPAMDAGLMTSAALETPAAPAAIARELWLIRAYAQDQGMPAARQSFFLRADAVDVFLPRLELTGLINCDVAAASAVMQFSADYYWSDLVTVGGVVTATVGSRRSDFGSLPQATSVLLKVARYL